MQKILQEMMSYLLILMMVTIISILGFRIYLREKHFYLKKVQKIVKKRKKKLLKRKKNNKIRKYHP